MGFWSWLKSWFGSNTENSPREDSHDEKKPIISLVLLLKNERYLDDQVLTQLVNKSWDVDLGANDPQATEFVAGASPVFVIQFRGKMFLVNNFPRPYVEDVEAAAQSITELRLRKAFLEHQAWLSVDLLGEESGPLEETYRLIGRLVATLADTDCLALYSPATDQMMPYDESLEEKLRGSNVLEVFSAFVQVPVLAVGGDDPRMLAAQDEARQRWPEFLAAFQRRRGDQTFAVKLPFVDGDQVEFMWVSVTAIDGDLISGRVDNDPVEVRTVRSGSRVRVSAQKLNDWIFMDGETMHGGFTIKAIQEIQRGGPLF